MLELYQHICSTLSTGHQPYNIIKLLTPWPIPKKVCFSKYLLRKIHFSQENSQKVSSYSILSSKDLKKNSVKIVTRRYTVTLNR